MTKNIIVVSAEQIAKNYSTNNLETFQYDLKFTHVQDFAKDLTRVAKEITAMLSSSFVDAASVFRDLFAGGLTHSLLQVEDTDKLEKWKVSNEDYKIIVILHGVLKDRAVVINKDQISW